jgi:asparagine synthase (glutamine-hydrolysing)
MCGITGIVDIAGQRSGRYIRAMTAVIGHRGPNDEGYLLANTSTGEKISCSGQDTVSTLDLPLLTGYESGLYDLAFGHRRLAVIDLSPGGHGPMCYLDNDLWITFNGEIYNYLELRKELKGKGYIFHTRTDTEVVLAAYAEWGMNCLHHFNGMWSFALFDFKNNCIFCSRDRAGVKPFYYYFDEKRFCFASEIKAILKIEDFSIEPNEQIIADYLLSGLIDHTNETFFKNIYQLRPGEYLLFKNKNLTIHSYWDIEAKEIRFNRESDYAERFQELLQDSIRLRLRSDVPIGTCLSGGLDSSSIVCLANKLMFDGRSIEPQLIGKRQKTFSSCFKETSYDERKFIEIVLEQTGAEKNYVFAQPEGLSREMERLLWYQDEPFGSTSIYAQWNVMRAAKRRNITVLLDGQGGDELLAGYLPSFLYLFRQMLKERAFKRLIKEFRIFQKKHGNWLWQFLPRKLPTRIAHCVSCFVPNRMTKIEWAEERFQKKYRRDLSTPMPFNNDLNNYLYRLFRFNALPGLLHYEDRNSMAFSLETRLPFLDYRLVEYVFQLPVEQKVKEGVTKVVLRKAMEGIIPEAIRNRTDKMGFSTPMGFWLKGPLQGWVKGVLDSQTFKGRGYLKPLKVQEIFTEHCDKKVDHGFTIWRWVNLELWMRTFIDKRPRIDS